MKKEIILQDYENSGTTYKSLKDEIEKLIKHTAWVRVYPTDLAILSFKEVKEEKIDEGKTKRSYIFYLLNRKSLQAQNNFNIRYPEIPITTIIDGDQDKASYTFLEEIKNTTGLMIGMPNNKKKLCYYGVTKDALRHLAKKAGLGGSRIYENSTIRDAYIASGLLNPNLGYELSDEEKKRVVCLTSNGLTFTLRKLKSQKDEKDIYHADGTGMILSVYSGSFLHRSANVFTDIIDKLKDNNFYKKSTLYSWENSKDGLRVTLDCSEKARELKSKYELKEDIDIKIHIKDSDNATSSLSIDGRIIYGNSKSVFKTETTSLRNGTELILDDLMADINEKVTKQIKEIVKQISKHEKIIITFTENQKNINKLTEIGLKSIPSINTILGKRRINLLKRKIENNNIKNSTTMIDFIYQIANFPFEDKTALINPLGEVSRDRWYKESTNLLFCNYDDIIDEIAKEYKKKNKKNVLLNISQMAFL